MKKEHEIKKRINFLKSKIDKAKETGKGYSSYAELRVDSGAIKTLGWVLK